VIIDIGTGDGRFVYQSARRNPNKFYIGIDPVRDKSEIEHLGITPLTLEFIDENYRAPGFEIIERGIITSSQTLDTSWAKRLQGNEQRRISFIVARAV